MRPEWICTLVMATVEQYQARIAATVTAVGDPVDQVNGLVVDLIWDVMDSSAMPEDKLDQVQNILTAGQEAASSMRTGATVGMPGR